jgi:hypothetical protein
MDGLTSGVEFVVIPNLGEAGAFDPVLDGISAVIHLASPLAKEARPMLYQQCTGSVY